MSTTDTTSTSTPGKRPAPKRATAARRTTASAKPATATARRSSRSGAAGTAAKRSATTRSTTTKRTAAARRATPTNTIETVGSYAERAVLIQVGAALAARDRFLAGVGELPRDPSQASARAQAQLRKFERRGTSARNSLEREARRTRVRLERELRRRRHSLDRAFSHLERRRSSLSHTVSGQFEDASNQIERTVQARVKEATSLAGKVQDRIKDLV